MIGMIECSASLVHERRCKDPTRNRDADTLEQIEYHQQISRSFLIACCATSGALYVPINNNGTSSDAANQLVKAMQSYKIK